MEVLKRFLVSLFLAIMIASSTFHVTLNVEALDEPDFIDPQVITQSFSWDGIWDLIRQYSRWDLEWFDGSSWISKKSCMQIIRNRILDNTTKITLNFTSEEAGSYRLTFAIDDRVKKYVNQSSMHRFDLEVRDFHIIFDWSDLASVPNLILKHGVRDGYFWFRARKDNVPANRNVVLDPTIITYGAVDWSSRYANQIKTFRNPRGTQYCYALVYKFTTPNRRLSIWKSQSGTSSWTEECYIEGWGVGAVQYESSSLWMYDNGSACIIYVVWTEQEAESGSCFYRRGVIDDSNSTIALESTQTILGINFYERPVITLADDGFLWVVAERKIGGSWILVVDDYTEVLCQWTKVGSDPYLDTLSTSDYVHTDHKPDEVYYWDFNNLTHSWNPDLVKLKLRCQGDGGDYVDVYLWDGSSWSSAYSITPPIVWGVEEVDVTGFLDTNAKVQNARLKMIKGSLGSSNELYVCCAYLKVSIDVDYDLVCVASNVTYEPTSSDWSAETIVYDDGVGEWEWKYPTLCPLESSYDVALGWRWNNSGTLKVSVLEASWDGSSFTFQSVKDTTLDATSTSMMDVLRLACDSNNLVHLVAGGTSGGDHFPYYCNYTVASGFACTWKQVTTSEAFSISMSIDLTASPNKICIVYSSFEPALGYDFLYKIQTLGSIDFLNADETRIIDTTAWLCHLSASYRDMGRQVQCIYTRATGWDVCWIGITTSTAPFEEEWDCNYIGLNSTIAGNVTEFRADWTDLNESEGLSHNRFCWNNTGAFVNDTWTDSWKGNWSERIKTLNLTVNLVICARFYVNDSSGEEHASTWLFFTTYLPPNQYPVAVFFFIPPNPRRNENVTFNATESLDPDGTIVSYAWDFGDGYTGIGMVVNHTFAFDQSYNVTLTVTDDDALTGSCVESITPSATDSRIVVWGVFITIIIIAFALCKRERYI